MARASARKRVWEHKGLRKTARDGVSYQAYVCHMGQRFRMSCHSAKAQREIEAEVYLEMRQGTFSKEFYSKTVEDVIVLMLEQMKEDFEADIIPFSTYQNTVGVCLNYLVGDRSKYEVDGKRHVIDKMIPWSRKQGVGDMRLCNLTAPEVNAFLRRLRNANANYDLRSRSLSMLRKVLDFAIQHLGWARTNPCNGIEEKKSKAEMVPAVQVPEQDTIRLLRTVADELQSLMLEMTCSTALRVGELMALQWGQVKLAKNRLEVTHTIDKLGRRVRPKSESGMRPVDLADDLVEKLTLYRMQLTENSGEPDDDDFVFFAKSGRHFVHSTFYEQIVRKLFEKAENYQMQHPDEFDTALPATLKWKDFRHFAISCWLTLDFSDVVIWTMAGHSSFATIERTYGHMLNSKDRVAKLTELHRETFGD